MKKILFDYNNVFNMSYFGNLNIYNAKSIRMYGKWNKKCSKKRNHVSNGWKNEVKNKCFYRCVWNQVYNDDTKAKGRSIPVHCWK